MTIVDGKALETSKGRAEPQEVFKLLYASLVKYHEGFVEGGYKVIGFLLLVLAWLLTSSSTQDLFGQSLAARGVATVALVVGVILFWVGARRAREASEALRKRLGSLDYMDPEAYEDRQIPSRMVTLWVAAVALLALLQLAVIWWVLPTVTAPADEAVRLIGTNIV